MNITPLFLFENWAIGFGITIGFAMLFNTPRNLLWPCSVIGGFGIMVRNTLRALDCPPEVGTFCGSLLVGLFGFWQARRISKPRLVFTITGIIAMVPGVPAYEMLMYLRNNQVLEGLQQGYKATIITVAIAVGLAVARLLTEIELRSSEDATA